MLDSGIGAHRDKPPENVRMSENEGRVLYPEGRSTKEGGMAGRDDRQREKVVG